jgi:hypothetical protein
MGGASLVMGDIDLPRHEDHDLAVLRENENEWLGRILNEQYEIGTFFGKITLPADAVAGLSVPADDEHSVQVVLLDGQLVSGKLLNGPLRMKLTSGNEMALPTAKLATAAYAISPRRPETIAMARPTLVLRSGQHLAFRIGDLDLKYQTLCGETVLDADDLLRIEMDTPEGGLHRAIFRNGSVLSGLLLAESLKLNLDLGSLLEIRRQAVSQFILPADDVEPAGLCDLTLRNEDQLFGRIADEVLTVETQFGKVTVKPEDIDDLSVPPETPLGQVAIKLHNGTTVTGKFVGESISFQVEPGPKLAVFIGNVVQMKCPGPKGAGGSAGTGANVSEKPEPARVLSSSEIRARAVEQARARMNEEARARAAAEEKARADQAAAEAQKKLVEEKKKADEAAQRGEKLKILSAMLKRIHSEQEKLSALAAKTAKEGKEKNADVSESLKNIEKKQADMAKKAKAVAAEISFIQKEMLGTGTTKPK